MLVFGKLLQLILSFQYRDPQCWSSNPDSVWNYLEPNSQTEYGQRKLESQWNWTNSIYISYLFLCSSPETGHHWFYSDNSKKLLFSCCWYNRKKTTFSSMYIWKETKWCGTMQHQLTWCCGVPGARGPAASSLEAHCCGVKHPWASPASRCAGGLRCRPEDTRKILNTSVLELITESPKMRSAKNSKR